MTNEERIEDLYNELQKADQAVLRRDGILLEKDKRINELEEDLLSKKVELRKRWERIEDLEKQNKLLKELVEAYEEYFREEE